MSVPVKHHCVHQLVAIQVNLFQLLQLKTGTNSKVYYLMDFLINRFDFGRPLLLLQQQLILCWQLDQITALPSSVIGVCSSEVDELCYISGAAYLQYYSVLLKRCPRRHTFLPLDESVASMAAFVILSGGDGWRRFWSQLSNSKTVRDRPYLSMGS